jgi:hypothetical protein
MNPAMFAPLTYAHFAQLGQWVLSIADSAYEPVLERYPPD